MNDKTETLKKILIGCQDLESINICANHKNFLNEKEFLGILGKFSPKHLCEIRILCFRISTLRILPEELEEFFINWKNRIPQKSLSLFLINTGFFENFNIKVKIIVEKYMKMGVVKKFVLTL